MSVTKTNAKLTDRHDFLINKIRILNEQKKKSMNDNGKVNERHRNRLERCEHQLLKFLNNRPFLLCRDFRCKEYVEFDRVLIIYEILVVNH